MKEKEKKAHGIQLLLRCVVRDPDGKIITDTGQKPAKSFVLQFLIYIHALIFTKTNTNAKRTDGVAHIMYREGDTSSWCFRVVSPVAEARYGVVVGTGDTAEDNEDYSLETQLTEGVIAGRISHGATVVGNTAVVGSNVDLQVNRAFTNLTGSTITVKEAGLYTGCPPPPALPYFFCLARDVLPAPVEVPNYCSLTVYYTLRTTV